MNSHFPLPLSWRGGRGGLSLSWAGLGLGEPRPASLAGRSAFFGGGVFVVGLYGFKFILPVTF